MTMEKQEDDISDDGIQASCENCYWLRGTNKKLNCAYPIILKDNTMEHYIFDLPGRTETCPVHNKIIWKPVIPPEECEDFIKRIEKDLTENCKQCPHTTDGDDEWCNYHNRMITDEMRDICNIAKRSYRSG